MTAAGTTAVRAGFELDVDALTAWLGEHVDGFAGPLTIEQFSGGQSNPTFRLNTPRARYVLRRKPMGDLLPGAHAIDREVRIMRALERCGIPVPRVRALCTDADVIGSWFYVMDMVEGRIFWNAGFPDAPPAERAALYDAMNATIAGLHALSPQDAGLADYGRHGGYFARQVARWSRQYRDDAEAGRSSDMDFLVEWLPAHLPAEGKTRIVHGDFRVDNLIFHPVEPRVIAMLDWELSTLGDPVTDFAYHLMMYRVPSVLPWGLADRDLAALGLPDERSYIAGYCRRTGREHLPDLTTHLAFNMFRFAAIIHGIKGRLIRGTAASAEAARLVSQLDLFAATGRSIAERGGA